MCIRDRTSTWSWSVDIGSGNAHTSPDLGIAWSSLPGETDFRLLSPIASCTNSASDMIEVFELPTVSIIAQTNVLCNGESTGSATASATGGSGAYNYVWSNGSTTAMVTGLSAGTFTVSVEDSNNCGPATATIIITEPSQVTAMCTATNATCGDSNGTATVSATGGSGAYTYLWSDGQTTATATGLAAGMYTATVTDANSCTNTCNSTVVNIGGPTVLCSSTPVLCLSLIHI